MKQLEPNIPPYRVRLGNHGRRVLWYTIQLPRRHRWRQMRGVGASLWGPRGP